MSIRFPLAFVALASFVTSLSFATKLNSAPATQASADPSRFECQIAVAYAGETYPDHLTPDQISRINDVASAAKPKSAHHWFVLVLLNERAKQPIAGDSWMFKAVAYCIPEHGTPRVRRGSCVGLRSFQDRVMAGDPAPYVQVSPEEKPFGEEFDVPDAYCLPFGPPVDENGKPVKVEDDELARLVDFARSALRAARVAEPITRVMRGRHGDYTIDAGCERGSTIEIKKDAGVFRQVGRLGIWVF